MQKFTLKEAVRYWLNGYFSVIPTSLVQRAYKDDFEDLRLLTSSYPELDYPVGFGYMYHPEDSFDEVWIKENLSTVESIGFTVYESAEIGVLLGIDSYGYSFFDSYWQPLYKARGLSWHSDEERGEE